LWNGGRTAAVEDNRLVWIGPARLDHALVTSGAIASLRGWGWGDRSYETSNGFFTGGVHTRAALKAVAQRNQGDFEELYRAEGEERVLIVPTAASDAERINLVLSQAIDKLLADQRLLEFLAAPPN
jgi:hypothetical protein